MELWSLLRQLRERAGLKPAELAKLLNYSRMHISLIERSPVDGGVLPSEPLLRQIARVVSKSAKEREYNERVLLLERAKLTVAPEIAEHLASKDFKNAVMFSELKNEGFEKVFASLEGMPAPFIQRLRKDVSNADDKRDFILQAVDIDRKYLQDVLNGEAMLSRKTVIALAIALKQSIEEYLLLADYLPDDLKELFQHNNMLNMFRTLKEISPDDIDQLMKVIMDMLSLYKART
jgi:transcriptional regulator with XRE-family HTH domain